MKYGAWCVTFYLQLNLYSFKESRGAQEFPCSESTEHVLSGQRRK